VQFAANKKWAMSPLLSPPAGVHTDKTLSDKFVCTARIPRIAGKFNGHRDFGIWVTLGVWRKDFDRIYIRPGFSPACQPFTQLSAVSMRASNPVADPGSQNWRIKTVRSSERQFVDSAHVKRNNRPIGSLDRKSPMARSTEQSLLDWPAITLVSMKHVTSARLFAAKVVPTFVELLCATRGAGETITE
jgi:hypothetical protein